MSTLSFDNSAQELTYRRVVDYLKTSLFQDSMRAMPDRPHFDLLYQDATLIEVDVLPWEGHPWDDMELAIVRASSCVTIGSSPEVDLMRYLLTENRKVRFGAFLTDEVGQVFFANRILGGKHMDLLELQTCILSVAAIASKYDDIITAKFGGQRASEVLSFSQLN